MASKGYGITQQDMVCNTAFWTAATPCCLRGIGLVEDLALLQDASRLVFVSVQSAKPRRSVTWTVVMLHSFRQHHN